MTNNLDWRSIHSKALDREEKEQRAQKREERKGKGERRKGRGRWRDGERIEFGGERKRRELKWKGRIGRGRAEGNG